MYIYTVYIRVCVCVCVQESQSEVIRLQKQKEELCAQIRDLSLPVDLATESLPELKKQLRLLEGQAGERAQEVTALTAKIQQQQQVLAKVTRHPVSFLFFPCRPSFSLFFFFLMSTSDRSTCALRWRWREWSRSIRKSWRIRRRSWRTCTSRLRDGWVNNFTVHSHPELIIYNLRSWMDYGLSH